MAKSPFQTLNQFISAPFGIPKGARDIKAEERYQKYLKDKAIKVENCCVIDTLYLVHFKLQSESQKENWYDVVIEFFTEDEEIAKESSLKNYYLQFFSNSPSFIYKYAALYRIHGYLINTLYEKMDPEFVNRLPEKSNPKFDMTYDNSLYAACRYLQDNSFRLMRKQGLTTFIKKLKPEDFFKTISDFQDIKMNSELHNLEKAIKKEDKEDKAEAKKRRNEFVSKYGSAELDDNVKETNKYARKKKATKSTSKNGSSINFIKKLVPKLSSRKEDSESSIHFIRKRRGNK